MMSTVGKGFDKYGIREKIDIQALLSMIENNGGAKGLDLSGRDLSGIRLSPKVLYQIRDERKILERPIWQNENGGINLEGINLSWASLARADLSEGCLRYADLRGSELVEVDFIDTDLRDAIFWDARCDSAVFDGAYLHGAEIFGARFLDSTLCRENVGERIIQEYPTYTLPKDMKPMTDERNRFWQASKIYRHLKATFDGSGLYSDASWAYRRARRMEKYRARVYAIDSWKKKDRKASIKYLSKYITDVFVELLADYGESLFRVFFWVVFTWFGFAILYSLISGVVDIESGAITHRLIDLVSFSLGTMTTIEPIGLGARHLLVMRFLMPLQALISIALTGLFGFVLGNKINRA